MDSFTQAKLNAIFQAASQIFMALGIQLPASKNHLDNLWQLFNIKLISLGKLGLEILKFIFCKEESPIMI